MSELINNSEKRKELLKHMILQLHKGEAPEEVNKQLKELLQKIPYGEVVEVEQELINEGLPEEEVLKLCDVHTQALEGNIDLSQAKIVPPGHPVDTFKKENQELLKVVDQVNEIIEDEADKLGSKDDVATFFQKLKLHFNNLMDVDKHYLRKENLLFPFLEKHGITGPPKVMWGKHDETRELLKAAIESLNAKDVAPEEAKTTIDLVLKPAAQSVADMVMKEEEILLPMTMDKLTESEWYEIYQQTLEIGFCLYDPQVEWKPEGYEEKQAARGTGDQVLLPSGSFTTEELLALLNTLPIDMTFVDRNDKVKYFSQGAERIFTRSRAILNRDVRLCHPPSSVNVVEQIVEDFKSGKQSRAPFWIQLHGKFVHIEYFALRNEKGEYLGTLEVSQDLTAKRKLEGEQRLLSYAEKEGEK